MKAIIEEGLQEEIANIKKRVTFYKPEFKCDRREVRHFITAIPVKKPLHCVIIATLVDFTKILTLYTVDIIKC